MVSSPAGTVTFLVAATLPSIVTLAVNVPARPPLLVTLTAALRWPPRCAGFGVSSSALTSRAAGAGTVNVALASPNRTS